jgi:predicted MPP superfamily phosphohydrolase
VDRFGREALAADALARKIRVRRFAGPARFAEGRRPLRVAHLTDLHVGRVTPLAIHEAAVALTNAERPDLVVMTGDFVCHSQDYLDALSAIVRGFDAPVFATLGNHDHWSGGPEVRAALERGGAEVLSNVSTIVELGGERLQVLGLDDAYTSHADRARATRGLDPRVPTLGLSHIAEEADGLWHAGVELVLAGHTHAGQVTLAGLHELALGRLAGHRYVHGLYGTRREPAPRGAVYVGAGLGAAVMPLRLGERGQREITMFELGAPLGSVDEDHEEQEALPGRAPSEETRRARVAAVERKRARRARGG